MKLHLQRDVYVPDYEGDKSKSNYLYHHRFCFRQMLRVHKHLLRSNNRKEG